MLNVIESDGLRAIYSGIGAGIMRHLTYQSVRFAIYENWKNYFTVRGQHLDFATRIVVAGTAGFLAGGFITPVDLICVRMQNDVKLPFIKRRNYKNVFDGLVRVIKDEGLIQLYRGSSMACSKGALMTIGQLATYDVTKEKLLELQLVNEGQLCYLISSIIAGTIATSFAMPVDVMKTKIFSATPGKYSGVISCFTQTLRAGGPLAFYKGFYPSFVRITPATVITFLVLEEMKKLFGSTLVISN